MKDPEIATFWDKTLRGLINAIGEADAKAVADETARRMGHGGTSRQWLTMLLKVLTEYSRERGYEGSVVALANALSAVDSAVAPTDPES